MPLSAELDPVSSLLAPIAQCVSPLPVQALAALPKGRGEGGKHTVIGSHRVPLRRLEI